MARQRAGACARSRRLARPARAGRGRARQARDGDHAATGKRAPARAEAARRGARKPALSRAARRARARRRCSACADGRRQPRQAGTQGVRAPGACRAGARQKPHRRGSPRGTKAREAGEILGRAGRQAGEEVHGGGEVVSGRRRRPPGRGRRGGAPHSSRSACEEPRGGLRGGPAARAPAAPPANCEKVSAEGVEEAPATGAQGLGLRTSVQAAGGVPMRRRDDGAVEVLLVHRPRYLDWTFPKGKVRDGERDEDAALRELREETGLVCELGRELAGTQYKDTKLRDKTVRYWVMENCSGSFESNDEVDRIEWLTLDEAAGRLSHRRDLDVLRSLELTQ